jgi:tRNA A-37 threonylcarbamoyl transferase component Bud32
MEAAQQAGGDVETTVREPTLRIGKYAVTDTLGKGASGTVYRALDTFSGQEVALKVIDERFFVGTGIDESTRQQFMNEASLAGQLQHPHICAILEASIEERSGYIALEYVPGGTLASAIKSGTLPRVEEVIEIAFKCCGALDYAHRLGIIHRDIKPANLMIAEGTQVKIVDFGAAQLTNTQLTQIKDVGTPSYMSPEQVRGDSLTFQSDMFSLGVVIYELLTGQRPFPGESATEVMFKIVEMAPPAPNELRSDLPREMDGIVMRMLQKRPEQRYASWADLAFDLAEAGRLSIFKHEIADHEKFTALRAFQPLQGLGDAEIWELVHASRWVRVPAQTTLMREGDKGSELLFLATGEVKVVKHGRLLNVLRSGSYFGEMAYVKAGQMARQATVETLTEALIAEFRPAALKKLSERCQLQLSVSLLNTVVDRLAFADERIAHA